MMVATIGLMVASYIFTRMVQLMTAKESGSFVIFCAIITLLVSILGAADLLMTSTQATNNLLR